MDEHDLLAERFETHRARLRAIAYQTLARPATPTTLSRKPGCG
jgi:hypothetical protein